MDHSTPEHGFLGLSESFLLNAANYLFPTNWAKPVEWAILHLNMAVFACRSLLANCGKISFFSQTGRIKAHGAFNF